MIITIKIFYLREGFEFKKTMRDILAKQAIRHAACVTPDLSPVESNLDSIPPIAAEEGSPEKDSELLGSVDSFAWHCQPCWLKAGWAIHERMNESHPSH